MFGGVVCREAGRRARGASKCPLLQGVYQPAPQENRKIQPLLLYVAARDILISRFIFGFPPTSSKLPVASCVVIKADPEALNDTRNKPVIRPYTPAENSGELKSVITKYETGVMSKYIHSLKIGDNPAIKGPVPKFQYRGL
ncbi:hypothetical protein C8J57DRAFT_12819 [Mycena rebaudengoi]|nr:hypothetical protein C8J57DRAFT_12819 [Mycena rebaudengoi]